MKLKTTISLILLTLFLSASVFSQAKSLDSKELKTEFIRLKNVPSCPNGKSGSRGISSGLLKKVCNGYGIGFFKIVNVLGYNLTRRGTIEIDARSNTLIITDTMESVSYIKEIIIAYDYSEIYKISKEEYKEYIKDLRRSACCGFAQACPNLEN